MNGQKYSFFCSWSGGKDSCMSLYYAVKEGGIPRRLLTVFTEDGEKSRSHGLPLKLVESQARSLGLPLTTRNASWESYEEQFVDALEEIKEAGIGVGVFGDIDIEEHREWVKRVCSLTGIKAYHPLWKKSRRGLLEEFISLGFRAVIIAVKDGVVDKSFLGKELDIKVIEQMERMGVDPSGEQGEFHTVVTDGPLFSFSIPLRMKKQVFNDGYWFQVVDVTG